MKAIFFDLDGVLIDTEWIYNKCWTQASKDLGYDLPPTEILKLRSCDKLAAVPIFGSVENYLAVRERRKQIMEKMLETTPILPKKGVVETVEGLRKTD
ncbi:MAG: HAD family phosphatase, partial [Oscillospiraceae bacterium]|nr:HAD family phosphatase [Oscillospiraceae bacterium]